MASSKMGDVRPNPETGHRQVLVKEGRAGSRWADTPEAKREDLPHGGILLNGFRKHIDEFKGNLDMVSKAQGEKQTPEGKRVLAGLRGGLDPNSAQNKARAAAKTSGGSTGRRPSAAPKAAAPAPKRQAPMSGGEIESNVASHIDSLKSHLLNTTRKVAVDNNWGHAYDTAAGHLTRAMDHFDRAKRAKAARNGYDAAPAMANAALYVHNANKALAEAGAASPIDQKETARNLADAQAHAAKSGRGEDGVTKPRPY